MKYRSSFACGAACAFALLIGATPALAQTLLPYRDVGPYGYAEVSPAPGLAAQLAAPSQVPRNRILVVAPGCRTQALRVPAERGGERLVRITRCY